MVAILIARIRNLKLLSNLMNKSKIRFEMFTARYLNNLFDLNINNKGENNSFKFEKI